MRLRDSTVLASGHASAAGDYPNNRARSVLCSSCFVCCRTPCKGLSGVPLGLHCLPPDSFRQFRPWHGRGMAEGRRTGVYATHLRWHCQGTLLHRVTRCGSAQSSLLVLFKGLDDLGLRSHQCCVSQVARFFSARGLTASAWRTRVPWQRISDLITF